MTDLKSIDKKFGIEEFVKLVFKEQLSNDKAILKYLKEVEKGTMKVGQIIVNPRSPRISKEVKDCLGALKTI
jgi:hypothetical protein